MKKTIIIALVLLSGSIKAQTYNDSLKWQSKIIWLQGDTTYYINNTPIKKLPPRDTSFVIFLEVPSGLDLYPSSWPVDEQSTIRLIWKRGYSVNYYKWPAHPDFESPIKIIDYYLYIDKKTRVKNRVVFTINDLK